MTHYINGAKVLNTVQAATTTAEYVVARLVDLGITHSFSVPGDFAFAIDRALISNPKLQNIVNANELNASYAADGYARIKGASILATTYAVGELSALNGVMGSKAENVVVFHLVGAPTNSAVARHKQIHHSLGDGVFGQFVGLSAAAACVSAIITPDNARREMNRVISEAFKYRQPAYISIALDDGNLPITDTTPDDDNCYVLTSNSSRLTQVIELIKHHLACKTKVVAIPSLKLDRYNLTAKALQLVEKLNIPFVIMPHDKSVFAEDHPQYAGFYAGELSDPGTAEIVEQADLVLDLGGVLWSDFNTAGFTNQLDTSKVLTLAPWFVADNQQQISNVYLAELLEQLLQTVTAINYAPTYTKPQLTTLALTNTKLSLNSFYQQLVNCVTPNDILVIETGSSSLNLPKFSLPAGVKYHNQTLWGSIGWATPATLGVALANPKARPILVTGEGSHQLTLNELGVMGRYQINPIIFCINNNGFMVERALEQDPDPSYDDLAQLNYVQLPQAFGCNKWLALKVTTEEELAAAITKARNHHSGVYIELITEKYDYGSALEFFNSHLAAMYG